jgi:hypothetical protein
MVRERHSFSKYNTTAALFMLVQSIDLSITLVSKNQDVQPILRAMPQLQMLSIMVSFIAI